MGYDLRITRAIDWNDNDTTPISAQEWMSLVADDTELTADPTNGPTAVQFGPSRWFDWFEGNVFTTDPDFTTVNKMLALAKSLAGAVQGDDGEFYDSATQWSRRRPDEASGAEPNS